jgi:hypothetical protein
MKFTTPVHPYPNVRGRAKLSHRGYAISTEIDYMLHKRLLPVSARLSLMNAANDNKANAEG